MPTDKLFEKIAHILVNLNTDVVIEQCPFLMVAIGTILKEVNYIIHEKEVNSLKEMIECLFNDWVTTRPKSEMDIMDKYAKRVNGLFCYVIFTSVAITPRVLDLISPKNESRGVDFIYPAYYGLDEEEHYYILMGHMLCVITVVFFVYISCDTIYMNIVQHACGLLNVSGHCFKWAVETVITKNEKMHTEVDDTYRKVRHSIKAHQHAMEYIMQIEDVHVSYLFIMVAVVVLSFSISLVRTSMMDPCMEFYKYCGFLVVQLVHLLFLSIQGHFIILSHDMTYDNIYSAKWYNSSPRTQTLYVLALRRSLTPPLLTAGGLISLNLETFAEYARIVTFPRIHIILNDYPYLITSLGVIVKFASKFQLKYLLGKIYEDWRAMTSEDEYKIMTKYAEKGIFSVILYILHISLCAALFMCLPFVSPILDILMPLNETRARLFVYPAYYFVDEDKYHYLIVGHMYLVVVMLISVFCACDANYVYAVQHACGLLAIAGNFVGFCLAENNCLLVDIVLNTPAMR
ncbi:PREDICTED: uncharacterized protein LOC108570075 [Habropoda laboriosa]|uniref:uncharacterized protein LOC108570075 n=1 Tax=Habropoda laboriosa TaxID=597456 RepID=UPI00083D90B9|nr:PREDICTED: uncharacterized protein LOC108570075 [Habropoda laboriosa]